MMRLLSDGSRAERRHPDQNVACGGWVKGVNAQKKRGHHVGP